MEIALVRYLFPLALYVALIGPAAAAVPTLVSGTESAISPSEQYVTASEPELDKMIVMMREFMRDPKNMRKAMAIMQADNAFQAVATAGYRAAKASAGDDKELNFALDNYRQYLLELTHGGLGNADEADWDKLVAEARRLGELVKAAARPVVST